MKWEIRLALHIAWLKGSRFGIRLDLRNANLCYANLCYANLRNADMSYADLSNADMSYADLSNADLSNADLCYANLRNADMSYANLRNADLRYADLCNADLCNADLDFASWPLWCGSLTSNIDRKIAIQLLFHFCAANCDDPEIKQAQNDMMELANKFHRSEVNRLTKKEL